MAIDFINSVNGTTGTAATQTSKFEMVILSAQAEKANGLEELLKNQMLDLQGKIEQVTALDALTDHLNGLLSRFPPDALQSEKIFLFDNDQMALANALYAANVAQDRNTLFGTPLGSDLSKLQIETAIKNVKSIMDNLSNIQQMDLLRVQILSGKRNEAVEMLTVLIKKFADSMNDVLRKTN